MVWLKLYDNELKFMFCLFGYYYYDIEGKCISAALTSYNLHHIEASAQGTEPAQAS